MKKPIDLTGEVFGLWTVIARDKQSPSREIHYRCRCECGTEKSVQGRSLSNGRSTNCGCVRIKKLAQWSTTHGNCSAPEWPLWTEMKHRCLNPKSANYHLYGGRGISVCESWMNFDNFLADMGPRPSTDHSIDRVDNDGNYEPGNCRWATKKEQARNTRINRLIEHDGTTRTLAEWAEITGIHYATLQARLRLGWPVSEALNTPARKKAQHAQAD